MLALNSYEGLSPILLSAILIIYLMVVELGNKKIRNALLPVVVILGIIFMIIAITSIYSTYLSIK